MLGEAIAQAFADLLGTTLAEGGYVAGAVFTVVLFVVFLILTGALRGSAIAPAAGLVIGAAFSRLMGWWPDWTIVLATLFLAVIVVGPFADRSGGG